MSRTEAQHLRPRTAVVVAPSPVPLRLGGAERHWETLRRSLEDAGVAADLVKIPVRELTLPDLMEGYEAFRLLDLSHVDLVISGKYPAWMVQHANHVVWMLHPLRGLYDTYRPASHEGMETPTLPELDRLLDLLADDAAEPLAVIDGVHALHDRLGAHGTEPGGMLAVPSPLSAAVVRFLDSWALDRRRVHRHFAISRVVAERPGYFPSDVLAEVIVPPSCLPDPAERTDPGRGLLTVSRLDGPKRVDLAIRAFRRIPDPGATLTVLGDGPQRGELERLAGDDPRIGFAGRVSDAELAAAYRDSRAVLVTASEEDFGYVAIEALQAGRPVITTTDSGGPAGLIDDQGDGLVVDPTPTALATASQTLLADADMAARMGSAGRRTAARHSWPGAIERLMSPEVPGSAGVGRRGRIVAVSTYPIADWPGGGPQRARQLLAGLAADGWDVEVVAVAPTGAAHRRTLSESLREVTVTPSDRYASAEQQLRRLTANVSITDIAASVLWSACPAMIRELTGALAGASAAIAVQPYMAPAVAQLAPELPLIFDAHNHEAALKAQLLPDDEAGHWMLERVRSAEACAATRARLVVASTIEDARALESEHSLEAGSVHVVPNGVDPLAVSFTPTADRSRHQPAVLESIDRTGRCSKVALFVGSAHQPNIDAASEIIAIASEVPEVAFALVGGHTDRFDARHLPGNVALLHEVSEARLGELLAGADVALNPMRTGGGSNLKVLQYFAAGLPLISTPLGLRGIPDPQSCAIVARIDHFATAIRSLLDSPAGSSSGRVVAARELVEAHFDWSVLAGRFAKLVTDVVTVDSAVG